MVYQILFIRLISSFTNCCTGNISSLAFWVSSVSSSYYCPWKLGETATGVPTQSRGSIYCLSPGWPQLCLQASSFCLLYLPLLPTLPPFLPNTGLQKEKINYFSQKVRDLHKILYQMHLKRYNNSQYHSQGISNSRFWTFFVVFCPTREHNS